MKKTLLTTFGIATMGLFGGTIASADTVDYTVKSGDTLSHIALENGTTIDRLANDNNLKNIDLIFVGDILTINTDSEPVVTQPVYQEDEVQVDLPDYQTQSEVIVEPVQESQPVQQTAPTGDVVSYAAQQMAARTGVSYDQWHKVIMRESGGNPEIVNSSGHRGLFQISPIHNNTDWSIDGQINKAVEIYQGNPNAWVETW